MSNIKISTSYSIPSNTFHFLTDSVAVQPSKSVGILKAETLLKILIKADRLFVENGEEMNMEIIDEISNAYTYLCRIYDLPIKQFG